MNDQLLDDELDYANTSGFDAKTVAWINSIKTSSNKRISNVKMARNFLFVIGGFILLAFLSNFNFNSRIVFGPIEAILKALVFILCGIGIKYNAKYSFLAALVVFIWFQIYFACIDIGHSYSWLLFKIPILFVLIEGISSSYDLERDAVDLQKLGVPVDEIDSMKRFEKLKMTN